MNRVRLAYVTLRLGNSLIRLTGRNRILWTAIEWTRFFYWIDWWQIARVVFYTSAHEIFPPLKVILPRSFIFLFSADEWKQMRFHKLCKRGETAKHPTSADFTHVCAFFFFIQLLGRYNRLFASMKCIPLLVSTFFSHLADDPDHWFMRNAAIDFLRLCLCCSAKAGG